MKNSWIPSFLVGAVCGLLAMFILRGPGEKVVTKIEVDTVYMREVIRDTVRLTETRILPRIDTVVVQLPGDTVKVAVTLPFEIKTYATENYRLDVSGYKPRLERIEIFQKTKVITRYETKSVISPPKWQVGAVVGAQAINDYSFEYIGARARYNVGILNIEATAGYSPSQSSLFGSAQLGVDIFRK